ncbi:MAG: polyphosphate kinase 1 [Anaerolineae bacterium]|nr:polyphosphate kinase 1 [Anaerolineae bacterium]
MAEHNQVTTQSLPELTPEVYINRELSTIEFQRRVLAQAKDPDIPLLERLKFIAIVGTNLDEFFMVRVASYLQKVRLGINTTRPDGYMPAQLLQAIRSGVDSLLRDHRRTKRELFKQLEAEGVYILSVQELSKTEQNVVQAYFKETIFPVLTPLAADHARPFPFISNLSLNLGVFLEREDSGAVEFARIKVPAPDILPRLVNLNDLMRNYDVQDSDNIHYVWIEDVIQNNLHSLFPGMRIIESYPFRVLRNADIDYEHEQEEELRDVMSFIEKGVRERRFGSVVRVSVPKNISDRMLKRLRDGLEVHQQAYVYQIDGTVGSADLFELTAIDRPDLKYPSYVPKTPNFLQSEADIWSAIRKQDRIIHHPYETFAPVEEFFRAAANDPNVLAIKATLYRVGKNSPVVQALMDARDNNKQVTVLVELKARFDEENNLTWARAMEEKEVHVIYGVEELAVKTHAKVALVVRREEDGVRRYLHLGTA